MKKKPITLSQASEAHILAKTAAGKSAYTLRNYRPSISKLQAHLASDPPLSEITKDQLVGFLAWLRSDNVSDSKSHIRRSKVKLSPKTILNVPTELSALWTWAVKDGYVATNILRKIEPPDAKPPVIEVFLEADCHAMIAACDKTSTWRNRALTRSNRGTGDRDKAIMRLLVDTGLRAQELWDIKLSDVNLRDGSIQVIGKGEKPRVVQFQKRTAATLERHMQQRTGDDSGDEYVFPVGADRDLRQMTRDVLYRLLKRIGKRAGVPNAYPHRFRHTFATNFLRNGGGETALQGLLEHADREMVARYVYFAGDDLAAAHKVASPVEKWCL